MSAAADDPAPRVGPERFKEVMGRFATGVTVVTALDRGVPVGFTCQSFVPLSLEPPLVALAPARSSTSWPRMVSSGLFCVNVLSESQVDVGRAFARSGGDKYAGVSWHLGPSGSPVIEGALAVVACRLELVHEAGDHELVVGRVLEVSASDALPLVFYRGSYAKLAPGTDHRRRGTEAGTSSTRP